MKTTRLLLAVLLLTATATLAADWPQWHGPNRDNISAETGLLAAWPAGGPPLAWKISDIGGGYSGVSVANGKIFTIGDLDDGAYVIALDANGGKQLWKAKLGNTGGGGGYPGPRATPTVDGDLVYSLGQYGDLLCVQAATGKEVWRKNLSSDFAGKMMSGWGYSESVLVDGDKLLCMPGGSGGTVAALNKKTGALIWRSKDLADSATYSSLVPVVINGVRQVIVLTDAHEARAMDATLGLEPRDQLALEVSGLELEEQSVDADVQTVHRRQPLARRLTEYDEGGHEGHRTRPGQGVVVNLPASPVEVPHVAASVHGDLGAGLVFGHVEEEGITDHDLDV